MLIGNVISTFLRTCSLEARVIFSLEKNVDGEVDGNYYSARASYYLNICIYMLTSRFKTYDR